MRRLVFALGLGGCGSCGAKESEATSSADAAARPDVRLTVERPGKAVFTVDGAVLAAHPSSVREAPFTAWRLAAIVPDWDERAPVDVIDEEGFRSPLLRPGESPGELEALLLVGDDGETRVIRVAPNKPITAHRGEARKDAGRVRHVAKLLFLDGDAGTSGPAVSLKVAIHGAASTWTRAELSKVEPIVLMSKDGDGERDAWPLRELAKALVGASAMPSEVLGEEPSSLRIDAEKWKDATLVPVLRVNRRGRLKLVWLDAKTKKEDHDEPQVKGVRELRFP